MTRDYPTEHAAPNSGKHCKLCGRFHYKCDDCGSDCTQGEPAGPATTDSDSKTRCWRCQRKHEDAQGQLHAAAGQLADALEKALALMPRGSGEKSRNAWAEQARKALRAAGRLK